MATQTLPTPKPLSVAVIVPPFKDFYATVHRTANLGAHTVESILIDAGHTVSFFDFSNSSNQKTTVAIPRELGYLKPYIISNESGPTSFFTHYRHFGEPVDGCAQKVAASSPALCCITCFAFCYAQQTLELADAIKQQIPDVAICVGGSGVSCYPEFFLRRSQSIDFAVCGEAEVSLLPLIAALNTGRFDAVPNLYWRIEHGSSITSNHQQQIFSDGFTPAVRLVHQTKNNYYLSTTLSRGCPLKCTFCSNRLTFGDTLRLADAHQLDDLIRNVLQSQPGQAKIIHLNFEDDNILLDAQYLIALCTRLKRQYPSIVFLAENGLDYRLLSIDLIDQLLDVGFAKFNLSLASVNPAILASQNRTTDLNHYRAIVTYLHARNIPVVTYFICGFAEDTIETIAANLAFLYSTPTTIGISPYYAVPGIGGFTDRNVFSTMHPCLCAGSSCYPWNGSISTITLVTAFRLSRLCNLYRKINRTPIEDDVLKRSMNDHTIYTVIKNKKESDLQAIANLDKSLCERFFNLIK